MKKEIFSLAFWMFFGFVLINAIDSILRFIINLYSYGSLYLKLSVNFLYYSIPILTLILYSISSIIFINYLSKKTNYSELDKISLPYTTYIIAIIIAIILTPIQNILSEILSEDFYSIDSPYTNGDLFYLLGIMWSSILICQWLAIIILSIYYYKKKEIKKTSK